VREPINNKALGRWKKYQNNTLEAQSILKQQGIAF
jgi:hypothetical protein